MAKRIVRQPSQQPGTTKGVDHANVARFEGSFAVAARPCQAADVVPWYRSRAYYLDGWTSPWIWKAACVEAIATAGLVYISGQIGATLFNYGTVQIGAYIGISNIIAVSTFIYATAAPTGGHLNPLISFSAMISGICPVARGVLYLIAQTAGGALAGGILTGIWGRERSIKYQGGGCFFDPAEISTGQAFLCETVSSFVLLYLVYGVGLDPRQAVLFGPKLGPFLAGVTLGLVSFASSGAIPGYAGAQMSPARCIAFGIARRDLSNQWIWWFGPAAGAILLAMLYNAFPPNFSAQHENDAEKPTLPIMSRQSETNHTA